MGGQYRIKGNKYPRMRRRRRRGRLVGIAVASAAVLGMIGWGTLQLIDLFTGGGGKASAAGTKAGCGTRATPSATPTATGALPEPGKITVNVFNATTRSGLAKQTADELKKRGFKIGDVGNATKQFDKKVKGTGLLLGPDAALHTSLPVLATQLGTAERRTEVARKGTAVDLIIGDKFKELTKKADADKALAALTNPEPTPAASKNAC
ncbi:MULTISPECIES: LytR C-terminal domain-containing protein [unclassified Streptomyces]|uniref:LytR C-terminal domain-containing protein n=1 Tax=unclassified Streptomyces TaxID=2593676 RepID=UPI002365BEAA|nr:MULTISPECIES: LytR C-terminal domain-containing protein [unclassified Streptomyces]MDF3148475.1 LytR C-terminal domain-containing protein [Streptomyces sp. T21Q-yed]WDF44702.1 LytR C-terminal domain-containing protein [Streptomyces sp. T12]